MKRPLSLAVRLTLLFGVAAAIVFPIFGWVITNSIENHFAEQDTDELEVIAGAVETAYAGRDLQSGLQAAERRFDDILVGHHSASLYLASSDGREIFRSSYEPDLAGVPRGIDRANAVTGVFRLKEGEHTYRVMTQEIRGNGATSLGSLVVAVPIDDHLEFLASFRRTLWLMIASSIVAMSAIGWLAVRQGHEPLRSIVSRIQRTSASELNVRVPPESVPSELSGLAGSFNDMLHRVDEAFRRLSHFNADIAHELRTPITNLMTQTHVALSRARTVEEYREVLYSNIEEYERMAQMVGDMLFLAQADQANPIAARADVDIAREFRTLFEYYEGWAEERGVRLEAQASATIEGDRQMIQRALGNLLSNAIRYTPSGGVVKVAGGLADEDTVVVSVENPGSRIGSEHLPKLFDRFYRVDASRQRSGEGAGLGLSIVKSIVEAHGGTIEVESSDDGTRFEIRLPRDRHDATS